MAARLWVGGNGAAAGPDAATALRYVYEPIGFMSFVFVDSHRGSSVNGRIGLRQGVPDKDIGRRDRGGMQKRVQIVDGVGEARSRRRSRVDELTAGTIVRANLGDARDRRLDPVPIQHRAASPRFRGDHRVAASATIQVEAPSPANGDEALRMDVRGLV
jgi:hypothetical protein